MRTWGFIAVFALVFLSACAASLPVRDFRTDYDRAKSRQSVTVAGYPPFRVLELREQRRIKVEVNVLHQAFGGMVNPLILLSITDGIPPLSAHQAAAQAYLAETWRPGCAVEPVAVTPNGRAYEFRYSCQGGA
jgi:hypothetical protein